MPSFRKVVDARKTAAERMQKGKEESIDANLLKQLVQALSSLGKIESFKGEPGPMGPKPILGKDYFLPKDGKDGKHGRHGLPGRDGIDGDDGEDGYTPIKGIDYFDGEDGEDADLEQVRLIVEKSMADHTKEFDHALLHDKKQLGRFEIDDSVVDGKFLFTKGEKIIGVDLPAVQASQSAQPYFARGGGSGHSSRYKVKTITASYTLDALDEVLHVDASAGNIIVTFYAAEGNEGSHVFIKRVDDSLENSVTFVTQNGETIDFETLFMLVNQGSGAEVYTDAVNFFIKHN